jgi:hypothetical protein
MSESITAADPIDACVDESRESKLLDIEKCMEITNGLIMHVQASLESDYVPDPAHLSRILDECCMYVMRASDNAHLVRTLTRDTDKRLRSLERSVEALGIGETQ